MLPSQHQHQTVVVSAAVLTVSDTRTPETDSSGRLIRELLEGAGHRVFDYAVVSDEAAWIAAQVERWCNNASCQAVIVSGGTGFAPRDVTCDAIEPLLERRLDGFGELFRSLSFAEIGPAAMLSGALAGMRNRKAVFALPGSSGAVRLAMEKLILPTLGHLTWLLNS
ncbi:MAG: MogA/MoaB family molybdenum cofactor biosynthesis protein [Phycisphaerae bacterium]|nr:MAG: MogA/MoaB family molybdenum cofactor biosynthesis protein [Planctomycetota bacterium]KAB2948799.1 MAG: MogA/MoaB family molybdenum cofactor biosynthesis protein [Phycisphaerae bacterium]MBE7457746.1 MogA/MoaB family molybdenum cofactor biosynthesis protein [Planctomycetia bacterium]MBZ0171204.1 MogA/MoaB family molybdenum cofactor biosynthesis protein [Phycisphaerales bacterium]MCK6463735.1 MogA/MoaB family molybdenum cofactor biosynthesis protein [Phycisphaerae bacterium]